MTSPWSPSQRPPMERPWVGMALLAAVPLLALILIRMLWSGSGLWFLTAGIILLGAAAVFFLARRPQEVEYEHQLQDREMSRIPLVLVALGVLFLAMLLLPNFSGGGSGPDSAALQDTTTGSIVLNEPDTGLPSDQVAPSGDVNEPLGPDPATEPAIEPAGEQLYVVVSGDTVWDIAVRFDTTIETIVAANGLQNAAELYLGQQLVIPAPGDAVVTTQPPAQDEPAPPGQQAPAGETTYTVVEGDTLWDIALQFDITVDAIIAANDLESPKELYLGQELLIPAAGDDSSAAGDEANPAQ